MGTSDDYRWVGFNCMDMRTLFGKIKKAFETSSVLLYAVITQIAQTGHDS